MDFSSRQVLHLLYRDHHAWLRRWLQRRCGGNAWDAADIAQDTFVRLCRRPEPADVREPRALLALIAERLLATAFRRRQIEQVYLETLAAAPVPVEQDAQQRLMTLETLVEIDRLLDGLPAVARAAFLMSRLEGASHAEVAERLGISVTTVKRHIIRAGARFYFLDADV